MARASETVRLAYHARLLLVSIAGMVGAALACTSIGVRGLGGMGLPAVLVAFGVLAFSGWLGWIDYQSATTLKIDASGVAVAGRRIAWADMRGLTRATGPFRLAIRTSAGVVRFQLLVADRPIAALKQIVAAAERAGTKVEPYLVRLAEHAEEDVD